MTEKIRELRKLVPIPMGEALQLLKTNDGDVEMCVYLFKAQSIKQICELTGCDEDTACRFYEREKYDFNRTVSFIREDIYDKNYKRIEGVTAEKVRNILQWIYLIEEEEFGVSLDYQSLDKALETMSLIPALEETATIAKKAKAIKDKIFQGYTDNDNIEEFVRRHRLLDDERDFMIANSNITLRTTVIKEELLRHLRNLQ